MANYLFAIGDYDASDWETKGLAIGCYTLAVLLVIFNTRFSYWASNAIGAVKLITLVFIAIVGLVVLGGHTRVEDPKANFRNAFEGEASPYGVTNALYKIIFAYAGYENAFNVVNEVKVRLEWVLVGLSLTFYRIQSRAFETTDSQLSSWLRYFTCLQI